MHTDTKNEQQYIKMTTTPVGRLISSLAIPTIISMLVTAVYNMADTYFVSQIGTSAAGAVGIVFSLMALIQAVGFALGMGAGSNISRLLGQKNEERAQVLSATAFYTSVFRPAADHLWPALHFRPDDRPWRHAHHPAICH